MNTTLIRNPLHSINYKQSQGVITINSQQKSKTSIEQALRDTESRLENLSHNQSGKLKERLIRRILDLKSLQKAEKLGEIKIEGIMGWGAGATYKCEIKTGVSQYDSILYTDLHTNKVVRASLKSSISIFDKETHKTYDSKPFVGFISYSKPTYINEEHTISSHFIEHSNTISKTFTQTQPIIPHSKKIPLYSYSNHTIPAVSKMTEYALDENKFNTDTFSKSNRKKYKKDKKWVSIEIGYRGSSICFSIPKRSLKHLNSSAEILPQNIMPVLGPILESISLISLYFYSKGRPIDKPEDKNNIIKSILHAAKYSPGNLSLKTMDGLRAASSASVVGTSIITGVNYLSKGSSEVASTALDGLLILSIVGLSLSLVKNALELGINTFHIFKSKKQLKHVNIAKNINPNYETKRELDNITKLITKNIFYRKKKISSYGLMTIGTCLLLSGIGIIPGIVIGSLGVAYRFKIAYKEYNQTKKSNYAIKGLEVLSTLDKTNSPHVIKKCLKYIPDTLKTKLDTITSNQEKSDILSIYFKKSLGIEEDDNGNTKILPKNSTVYASYISERMEVQDETGFQLRMIFNNKCNNKKLSPSNLSSNKKLKLWKSILS
jgi:hypothetical protein